MAQLIGMIGGGSGAGSAAATAAATAAINSAGNQQAGASASGGTGTNMWSSILDLIAQPTVGKLFGGPFKEGGSLSQFGGVPIQSASKSDYSTDMNDFLKLFLKR